MIASEAPHGEGAALPEGGGLALEAFDRALEQGNELLVRGDSRAAAEMLETALKFHPRHQRGRNLLGLALFKLGELAKSEALYRGLIEDHPEDPTLRINLGLVFLKSGAPGDAARCFETAIDLSPAHGKAQNYLGLSLAQMGELERARQCFVRCGNTAMAEKMVQAAQARSAPPPAPPPTQAEPPRPASPPAAVLAAVKLEQIVVTTPPKGTSRGQRVHAAMDELAAAQNSRPAADVPGAPGRLRDARPQPPLTMKPKGETDPLLGPAAALAQKPPSPTPSEPLPPLPAEQMLRPPKAPDNLDRTLDDATPPLRLSQLPPAELAAPVLKPAPRPQPPPPTAASAASAASDSPSALSDYTHRTRLAMPAGESGFAIGPTELVVHVHGEMLTRLDGMVASWGTMSVKPELKRFRGKATDKPFGEGARRMLRALGQGRFVISREGRRFTALELGDEPAYFREEILFAFEESLLFENGRVPSRAGSDLHLVHLRGHGRLLLVTVGMPRSAEVVKGEPLRIPMDQLVGWHGPNIQPRLVPICEEAPELGVALELSGEGRALVDAPDEPR